MANSGATVWWIEEATRELKDKRFSSAPRFGFRDEVLIRYATHPIDILVIPDQWAGSKAMTQAFERLKAKSA